MKRGGGFRRKTRYVLSKPKNDRGKLSLRSYFQQFKQGDRVLLKAEPSYQQGMYYPRYHGRIAVVISKRGTCYEVQVPDGSKKKTFVIHPVHLRRM